MDEHGWKYDPNGKIDERYLKESKSHPGDPDYYYVPMGFAVLSDGSVGFADIWGGIWRAPKGFRDV